MNIKQKFNEYIASGDISISDKQRDWILPFIERCVGEERSRVEKDFGDFAHEHYLGCHADEVGKWHYSYDNEVVYLVNDFFALTQEDKIK